VYNKTSTDRRYNFFSILFSSRWSRKHPSISYFHRKFKKNVHTTCFFYVLILIILKYFLRIPQNLHGLTIQFFFNFVFITIVKNKTQSTIIKIQKSKIGLPYPSMDWRCKKVQSIRGFLWYTCAKFHSKAFKKQVRYTIFEFLKFQYGAMGYTLDGGSIENKWKKSCALHPWWFMSLLLWRVPRGICIII